MVICVVVIKFHFFNLILRLYYIGEWLKLLLLGLISYINCRLKLWALVGYVWLFYLLLTRRHLLTWYRCFFCLGCRLIDLSWSYWKTWYAWFVEEVGWQPYTDHLHLTHSLTFSILHIKYNLKLIINYVWDLEKSVFVYFVIYLKHLFRVSELYDTKIGIGHGLFIIIIWRSLLKLKSISILSYINIWLVRWSIRDYNVVWDVHLAYFNYYRYFTLILCYNFEKLSYNKFVPFFDVNFHLRPI